MPPFSDPPEETGSSQPSEALLTSYALWEERPWEAPEVPPPVLLRAWADGLIHHPDFDSQIAESVNCERTLPLLDFLDDTESRLVPASPPALPLPAPEHGRPDPVPEPGQLWSTRSSVELFRDEATVTRWTFDPVSVLLVNGPLEFADGECVWRAVAVSPSGNWPDFCRVADDVEIHAGAAGEFVAHLWLEYPVSESQLLNLVGRVSKDILSHLAELGAGRPEGDALEFEDEGASLLDEEALRERDRLMARCAFLPMTADARRASREWMEGVLEEISRLPLEAGCRQVEQATLLAHAAGAGPSGGLAVIYPGSAKAFTQAMAAGSPNLPQATPVDLLILRDDPPEAGSEPIAQWDVAPLGVRAGSCFVVLDPVGRRVLALGRVRDGVATVRSRYFAALREARERSGKWVLVVFQPEPSE